jgi:hypothetical protein
VGMSTELVIMAPRGSRAERLTHSEPQPVLVAIDS